jgi:DtxR family Mn-dependent transcriptional regulator
MVLHGGQPLTDIPIDQPFQIVHIEDEPEEIYTQLVAEGLYPGMQVRMIEKSSSRVIFWGNGDEHVLAPIFAANVSVTPITTEHSQIEGVGEPLNSLTPGFSGEVLAISPRMRGAERRRMMDLGILPGTTVQADFRSPGGDPTAYLIRDTLIAIRNEQAELIRIKPVEKQQ